MTRRREQPKDNDHEIQQFHATIWGDKKRLKELFSQRMHEAKKEQDQHRHNLASTIVEALHTPNRLVQGEVSTFGSTPITSNAVYTAAANMLAASEDLIGEYERLDGMIRQSRDKHTDVKTSAWKEDVEATDRQLRMDAKATLRSVKSILGAADGDGEQEVRDKDADVAMEGVKQVRLSYELLKSQRYADG